MNSRKVILITGASSGIGKTTALDLIKAGHVVYGAARRIDKMLDLTEAGGHALEMDVTKGESVDRGVDEIIAAEGGIDVLINNAGFAVYGAVEDISLQEARRQYDVNLFGLARVTKAVLPHMRRARSGRVINISSMGGRMYTPLGAWYHSTKYALEGWSDCLRLELKQFNIDMVIIEPGAVRTEFLDVMYQPMIDASADGPYRKLTHKLAAASKDAFTKSWSSSPPSVISKVIGKATMARRPKKRYTAGKMAKTMIFIRQFVGASVFDKIIMSQLK